MLSKKNTKIEPKATKNPIKESSSSVIKKGNTKTKICVQYDVGFNNQIFIRGEGANLSWDKGLLLTNTKPDEWIWETEVDFTTCQFKVLINDLIYENGDNHSCKKGEVLTYTPSFS